MTALQFFGGLIALAVVLFAASWIADAYAEYRKSDKEDGQ